MQCKFSAFKIYLILIHYENFALFTSIMLTVYIYRITHKIFMLLLNISRINKEKSRQRIKNIKFF